MSEHTLLVVGGGDVAAALSALTTALGWRPVVVETLEATNEALPGADAVAVLSHHDDVDGPAIAAALAARTPYVGAMGSRKTQARRRAWLVANGVSEDRIDSVHGPAGLAIGADNPAEIALSILAEVVAVHRGTAGGSLRDTAGPIHPDLPPGTAECPAG